MFINAHLHNSRRRTYNNASTDNVDKFPAANN